MLNRVEKGKLPSKYSCPTLVFAKVENQSHHRGDANEMLDMQQIYVGILGWVRIKSLCKLLSIWSKTVLFINFG